MRSTTTRSREAFDVIGCSSISFRHRPFGEALAAIGATGFREIDLGALPGICDHVPVPLSAATAASIINALGDRELIVRSINADPGPLNDPALTVAQVVATLQPIIDLAARLGAAVVVPCGAQSPLPFVSEEADLDHIATLVSALSEQAAAQGVRLWIEALHSGRFCNSSERANALLALLSRESVGLVFDVSHIVAVGENPVVWHAEVADRVEHVHLRDARVGDINLSIGRGDVDFAAIIGALEATGFAGHYALELETHDIDEDQREAVAADALARTTVWLEATKGIAA
jgi:sugar phosphate isomerase/epimerase